MMKKAISLLLVVLMLASVSAFALAADDTAANETAASSAENGGAPAVVPGDTDDDDIIITPYENRAKLTDEDKADIEEAYSALEGTDDLTTINDGLAAIANGGKLVVLHVFFVGNKDGHPFNGPTDITVKDYDLSNFAALVFYNKGNWELVDATVDGNELSFTANQPGTFAILGFADEATSSQTGESVPYGTILGAVVLLGAAAWFFMKSRKSQASA